MINTFLMRKYPKTARAEITSQRVKVTQGDREKARRFDKTYFDTDRRFGYGGYHYNPKFFTEVVKDFIYYYDLKPGAKILDVGCGKGFMLHDFKQVLPSLEVAGIDISDYALSNAMPDVAPFLQKACCSKLPFADKSFDLVIAISSIHNLDLEGVRQSLKEIIRVSKGNMFVKVNGYKNLKEREALEGWNLVAKTILRESEWEELFAEIGYEGDYDFFKT
jgi:SAM-dependent methyltransferase